ncbi:hypothetical protein COBT_000746 [Conglomerata obtusa]
MNTRQENMIKKVMLRNDCEFVQLLNCSSHVSLYTYETEKWIEEHVEGPLYIYQTDIAPFYRLMVFNRKRNDIFMMSLDECSYYQKNNFVAVSFVDKIYGLWFFNENEVERLVTVFTEIEEFGCVSNGVDDTLTLFEHKH